jgi:hypothetical protein
VRDDALDGSERLELLLLALLVDLQRLDVLTADTWRVDARLPLLVRLDVVVDALQPLEALEEVVCLVCVVQMRKVFPFDVEALLKHGQGRDATR